jgi:hypothetical protein
MSEELPQTKTDEVVDELMPVDLDWRYLVRTYPLPALAVTAATGFWIGRQRGSELVAALLAFVTDEVTRNVHTLLGTEGAED